MANQGFYGKGDPLPAVPKIKPRERNTTIFEADAAGIFNIEDGTRQSSFGPVICSACEAAGNSAYMCRATDYGDGRSWTLSCKEGHDTRHLVFAAF